MRHKTHTAFWSCFWHRFSAWLPHGRTGALTCRSARPGLVLVRTRRRGEG